MCYKQLSTANRLTSMANPVIRRHQLMVYKKVWLYDYIRRICSSYQEYDIKSKEYTKYDRGHSEGKVKNTFKGDVRSNFYHIFFLSNLKLFFLTITKIYILSIFVFLMPKYRALKFFYCCHGCKICDVKIALFRKLRLRKKCLVKAVCLIVRVRIFHLIL